RYRCRKCQNKINEDILMEQFKEGLKCMVIKPEQLQAEIEAEEKAIILKEKELQTLNQELRKVNQKIDRIIDMYNDDLITKDIFSERIRNLQERKKQIENSIPEIEAEIALHKVSEIGKDYMLTQATTLYSIWDTLDKESQIKIIKELLSSIKVSKEKLEFEFFYLPELMEFCKGDHNFRDSWLPRA
ncbi:MAG: recombinase family protein, partial [Nitrospirae bacterium]|nr:recombinase family protein [Nitrospirota bacterium]